MVARPARTPPKSKAPLKAPNVKQMQELLRSVELRSTAPRLAVLGYFHAHGGTNSHADLFDAIGEQGFDRATVYRVLIDLAEAKILSRTDLGDHVWRFELQRGVGGGSHSSEHPHFVCVDCGSIACLPGLSIKVEGQSKTPKSVIKNNVAIQLKGLCDDCG